MARTESRYVCGTCGDAFLRWEGQCRTCGTWNSLVETVVREPKRAERARMARSGGPVATAQPLASVGGLEAPRLPVGIGELDRVLGGGLVPGSVVLLGGEPGIGKSTLLLQMVAALVAGPGGSDRGALYATGEESAAQVHLRAGRLGLLTGPAGERVRILAENEVGRIVEEARSQPPEVVVVDSIQTATVDELDGAAGSVGQVREATLRLMEFAKGEGTAVIVAGHVTKDGSIAGPKTLEHLVDAVVNLEGERFAALRLLRASKNRFGSTEEVGVFEMRDAGLTEVVDPGRAFLGEHDEPAPGSVIAPTMEGSRPLLVEVQALVSPARFGAPVRRVSGLDANRLSLLVAVLGRRAGVGLSGHDVYANLAGGLAVMEPGLDLPIALALASSLRDRPLVGGTIAIGEVGLLGELRPVAGLERRLREAARLGFGRAIVPRGGRADRAPSVSGMEVVVVATLADAVRVALAPGPGARGEAVAAMLG
jgi:DNA repair protein RadA/Sms